MFTTLRIVRLALAAGALAAGPALAQDRYAIIVDNGDNIGVVYVDQGDPRACSALSSAPGPTVPFGPNAGAVASRGTAQGFSMLGCASR